MSKKRENVQLLSKRTRHNQSVEKKAIGNKSKTNKATAKKGVPVISGEGNIVSDIPKAKETSKEKSSKKNK